MESDRNQVVAHKDLMMRKKISGRMIDVTLKRDKEVRVKDAK